MTKFKQKGYLHASILAMKPLWTAHNLLHLFIEEGNEFCEYGVQLSLIMLFIS